MNVGGQEMRVNQELTTREMMLTEVKFRMAGCGEQQLIIVPAYVNGNGPYDFIKVESLAIGDARLPLDQVRISAELDRIGAVQSIVMAISAG
jgi:hypothetical protein